MRTVREIYDALFTFAPETMKLGDWDNVGLLCGRFDRAVETVLVALDPLPDVIAEAEQIGAIFADRLNRTAHPLKLVLPTEGMRKNARKGGNMYSKETDDALLGAIRSRCGSKIEILELDGNLNDVEWGRRIARLMAEELKRRGIDF